MKKILTLLLTMLLLLPLAACEKNEKVDIDYSTPATHTDILGKWANEHNSYTTTLEFTFQTYRLEVINPFNPDLVLEEEGTYEFEDGVMTLTPLDESTSQYSTIEPYCENPEKTVIFFKPIGRFTKVQ